MDSKNIDLIHARITQIEGSLELIDPDSKNSVLWAVQALLRQAQEAADALWLQGIAKHETMAEAAI